MQACWRYISGLGARLWLLFMLVPHTYQAQGIRCRPCSKLILAKIVSKCYLTFGGWGYSTSLECEKSQVWALESSISEFETTGIRHTYTTKSESLPLDVEHLMTRVWAHWLRGCENQINSIFCKYSKNCVPNFQKYFHAWHACNITGVIKRQAWGSSFVLSPCSTTSPWFMKCQQGLGRSACGGTE